MMGSAKLDWEQLMERASGGDRLAREQLLAGHRNRLRQMIAARMDRRLVARIDPSDVVQDVLAVATRDLSDYLRTRPMPFYPWLRKLAWERLIELQRKHLVARKRSVAREQFGIPELPDESAAVLAERLMNNGSSPSARLIREEMRERVRKALDRLPGRDREVLVLRYLEQLSPAEAAVVLGISEGAVKTRQTRALVRLGELLGGSHEEGSR
jgi:RNA polymerase sigma-70 factor (ECF subfamily)